MTGNGQARANGGYAAEREPLMLQLALQSLRRQGLAPVALPECNGEPCRWVCQVADSLTHGVCQRGVLFCDDSGLACCIANKVSGIRAVAAETVTQARRAIDSLGANLLVVESAGRTFFEFKQILVLCCGPGGLCCPPAVACVLEELDGHAHR